MNLCSSKPASSYVVYGDWIFLNGTSRALLAYKVRKLFNLFELFHATEMRYLSHYCFAIIYSNNHLEKPTDKSHLRNKERFWSDKGNFQVHQFKLEWQCFTTDSSSWRRAIGNGWANVIEEELKTIADSLRSEKVANVARVIPRAVLFQYLTRYEEQQAGNISKLGIYLTSRPVDEVLEHGMLLNTNIHAPVYFQ